ncbi:clathrin light chain isoform X1 [Acyrthosiphon pisum]|uniref:Clathrin light chain n=1 Tax=Acyrthosiphon pisum TaxID=7029 RepID=A0A8R2NV43_ACYPI|nr:clathrin light chain isoform X1 [Acyrthosiphon pisum]
MDNFGDNFDDGDVDPAAEFLAREQTQLAGLEDDLSTPNVPIGVTQTLSNGSGSSFEIIDSAENQLTNPVIENGLTNGFTVTNSDDEKKLVSPKKVYTSSPIIAPKIEREEPEKIKKWREEQKTRLEEKDADEEKKKEELRLVAKSELEEWYKIHKEQIAKTKDVNRESAINAEKQFVAESDEIEPGTEWDRISKLCDFNPKSSRACKDVTRMRSIILQLKQTPLKKPVSPAK